MMKFILKIAGVLVVVLVVVVAAGAAMLATLNPNKHKDRVEAAVQDATGRELTIAGPIEVMYFPVLGFEAKDVRLGNPQGFADETFLSVGTVSAGVKVLPLLRRNIELSKVILWEPHIDIIRQADGATNLHLPQQEEGEPGGKREFSIEAIEISEGSVTYTDRASGRTLNIEPITLNLSGYAPGEDLDFSLSMAIRKADSPAYIQANVNAKINAEPQTGVYTLKDIDGKVLLQTIAAAPEAGEQQVTTPNEVTIAISGSAAARLLTQEISISDIKVSWVDSIIQGHAAIKRFDKPDINFALTSPLLDFDAFRSITTSGHGEEKDDGILPVALLQDMSIRGSITVDSLRIAGMRASNFIAEIAAQNGVIAVDPLRAEAYGGTEQARLRIDVRSAVPNYTAAGKVINLQAGDLIRETMGEEYMTGTVNMAYDLMAAGNTTRALRETAGGTVDVAVGEGVIRKWQLSTLVNQAIAFFESGQTNHTVSDQIQFTSMSGRFIGENGVFRNDDFQLIAPKSHALGSGQISLRDRVVDYTLRVGLGDSIQETGKHLPVRISGPLSGPGYSIDFKAVATEALREKFENKKQNLIKDFLGNPEDQEPAAGEEGGTTDHKDPAALFRNLLGNDAKHDGTSDGIKP